MRLQALKACSRSWARSVVPFVHSAPPHVSFGIYIGGLVLIMAGLVYAAAMLHAPTPWIVVGVLVVLGFGILMAVKATRQKDPAG
jgi:cadmium resistance protein CadD (predicted permease)